MSLKPMIRAEADAFRSAFEAKGAEVFEANILQPAGDLLDLYGEDIRARAFVTHDPTQGEMMLRPDFTLPLVQRHIGDGRNAARYTYSGEVFRRQEDDPGRAVEYLQVGYEVFGGEAAATDADVFVTFYEALSPRGLQAATGDIGLLREAVLGLKTSEARKAALLRHLWRPHRFKALLARFSGAPRAVPSTQMDAPEIGIRTAQDVLARIERLREDQSVAPISHEEIDLIDRLLTVAGDAPVALADLVAIADNMPSIKRQVGEVAARFDAIVKKGVPIEALAFETSFGRTTLEYYDGFVFGFFFPGQAALPPVASGGRYDALVRALGSDVPAVGGVIRPGLIVEQTP